MAHFENLIGNPPIPESSGTTGETEQRPVLGIIESRNLIRDCLAHYFSVRSGMNVIAVAGLEDWFQAASELETFLVVISLTGCPKQKENRAIIQELSEAMPDLPVVVLSEGETIDQIASVFEVGARGYVPTSLGLDVALDAMRLVKAGGVYLPQCSLETVNSPKRQRRNARRRSH